jgi:hypothetical protein
LTKVLQYSRISIHRYPSLPNIAYKMMLINRVSVRGFKGSEVQGSICVHGLHFECVFTKNASSSSDFIQNCEPNGQLLRKMSVFNEDFGSSMPLLCP